MKHTQTPEHWNSIAALKSRLKELERKRDRALWGEYNRMDESFDGLIKALLGVADGLERDCRNYPNGKFPSVERFKNRAKRLREALQKAGVNA